MNKSDLLVRVRAEITDCENEQENVDTEFDDAVQALRDECDALEAQ